MSIDRSRFFITGGGALNLSCATTSFCAAVDQNGNAVSFTGGSWSKPARIDSNLGLTSVACLTVAFCVAVDTTGNVLAFR
jgi:hypothetical protein